MRSGRPLVATDLDQTLIYSRRSIPPDVTDDRLVVVETYQDAAWSFVTDVAASAYVRLLEVADVVPTTTRTVEQLARVRLPGPPAPWAVAANGGVLLHHGQRDAAWSETVRERLSYGAPLAEVEQRAATFCSPSWCTTLRSAEGLFCYAVLAPAELPDDFAALLRVEEEWAAEHGWAMSRQGRKVYWVPAALTKSAAVREVARRCGSGTVLAAGDSRLDRDLLELADRALLARHGELAGDGWSAAHVEVTRSAGIAAGEEIVLGLLAHASQRPR